MRIYAAMHKTKKLLSVLELLEKAYNKKDRYEEYINQYDKSNPLDPIVLMYRRDELTDTLERTERVIFRLKMSYLEILNKLVNIQ